MKNRIITILIGILITVSFYALIGGSNEVYATTNGHTQEDAVAWANQRYQENWGQDMDGNGLWCIDLIHAYRDYLGVSRCSGHAYTYQNADHIPSGWSKNATPSLGDIVVIDKYGIYNKAGYKTGEFGHIGIVTVVNGNEFVYISTAQNQTAYPEECYTSYAACFIHPDFVFKCTNHKWDKGKVTKKAKCTKSKLIDGKKVFTCTVCGETKTEVIKASHSYNTISTKAATLKKNGSMTKKCTRCHKKTTTSIIRPKTIKTKKKLVSYNGKSQKPGVIVKDVKSKTIPKKYYTVSYASNKKIGKAKAIVRFKGRYKGTKILSFTIGPKGSKITKCAGYQKKIKVTWKKTSGIDGYQIQYATRKNFKNKKSIKIKANKKVTRVISKLKSGKTYYVRIRTYKTVKKTKYYSPWSDVKSVKTKKSTAEDIAGSNMSSIIKYLRAGNVSEVRSFNKKLPEIANESCVSTMSAGMKSAFKKEIQAWDKRKNEYAYYFYDYWLTDLDNDGTAELLLALWPYEAGAETIAYKYENGTLRKLGSVGGMETCHAYPKHNGIVLEGGRMGYNWFKLVTYSNGKLNIEELHTFDFTSGESYISLRNALKSHNQWNGERYVPVYDDLN